MISAACRPNAIASDAVPFKRKHRLLALLMLLTSIPNAVTPVDPIHAQLADATGGILILHPMQ